MQLIRAAKEDEKVKTVFIELHIYNCANKRDLTVQKRKKKVSFFNI